MMRFQVHFDEGVMASLAEKSAETGAPVAELIRRAVGEWLGNGTTPARTKRQTKAKPEEEPSPIETGGYSAASETPNRKPPQGGSRTSPVVANVSA